MMSIRRYGPLVSISLALVAVLIILSRMYMLVRIQETSMEPAFYNKEVILIRRVHNGEKLNLEYGDVVVFRNPSSQSLVIKRVILPERTPLRIEQGWLLAGGRKYFLTRKQRDALLKEEETPMAKESGRVFFAVGDNQFHSLDSREYGFVPYKNIVGIVPGKRKVRPVNEQ